jgi:hypothetical protein
LNGNGTGDKEAHVEPSIYDPANEEETVRRFQLQLDEERLNSTNERLTRLIQTNMNDTLHKLNGFSAYVYIFTKLIK